MNKYEPELGQAMFGNSTSEHGCPEFVEAGLRHLASEIERVEWNRTGQSYEAPTGNNGGKYDTDVFRMRAYYWGDDEELVNAPNFVCDGLEVRWYKYLGRGMSMNRRIDANEFYQLIDRCLKSVRARDIKLGTES